ncbi:MAG: efflux RND transporter permease subunit, partial [Sphingobium sp.]
STRPREAAGALAGIGLAALVLFFSFGDELLPAFRERHYVLGVTGPVGASFDWMRKTGAHMAKDLLAIPQILTVEQQMGRAEAGEDTWDPNVSEFHVRLKPDVGASGEDEAQDSIRKVLESYPAIQTEITTFLGDRIGESLSGETAAVTINVNGNDLAALDRIATQVATQLRQVPGAADVIVHAEPGTPMLRIGLDPRRMAVHGIAAADAEDAIQTVFQGRISGQVNEADRTIDVAVTVPPDLKRDPEAIGDILVRGAQGRAARLSDIAAIDLEQGRAMIVHEGGQRRQVVTTNPTRADISGFVADAKARIAKGVKMPKGVYLSWGGAAEGAAAASRQLAAHVALAAIAIFVLLVLAFGGMRPALLILAGMPLAMAGGVVAVALTGGVMSLGALVGFVTLFGISARNAILLVSHVDHLVEIEGAPWSVATILRATRERVTPILMTALVTAFGLAPLALESGQAGREVQGPMATVILGGLVSSLALTLLLMPALIWRWRREVPAVAMV